MCDMRVALYTYSLAILLAWILFGASCQHGHRKLVLSCVLAWLLRVARYEEAAYINFILVLLLCYDCDLLICLYTVFSPSSP